MRQHLHRLLEAVPWWQHLQGQEAAIDSCACLALTRALRCVLLRLFHQADPVGVSEVDGLPESPHDLRGQGLVSIAEVVQVRLRNTC